MSLLNATEFNTNPACTGVGPYEPVSEPFKTAQLAASIVLCVIMFVTGVLVLYMRRHRRRLRVRSPVPIYLGSFGGILIILIRSSYNYVGREYFPCGLDVVLFYLIVPICVVPDVIAASVFLAKQYQRKKLNQAALQALETRIQERTAEDEKRCATPLEFFQGFWDYNLSVLIMLVSFRDVDQKYFFHPLRRPSSMRESFYEIIMLPLFSLTFIIALAVRASTEPVYDPSNGCVGCIVQQKDVVIVCLIVLVLCLPLALLIYKVRTFNIPDPLHSVRDTYITTMINLPLIMITSALLATDPGNAMKEQRMDWHIIQTLMIWLLHMLRSTVQLFRTSRIQRIAEKNVTLLEILADPRHALLFEKHLIGELANENLLFWREGIKYKHMFDHSDFDFSQQTAKVLWRTFLSPHASLPINISDTVRKTIDSRFKGVVGKAVFDDALAEVYLMMQNGAFQRFIHSPAYRKYITNKADFSMAIVPQSGQETVEPEEPENDGVTHKIQTDIRDYIRHL